MHNVRNSISFIQNKPDFAIKPLAHGVFSLCKQSYWAGLEYNDTLHVPAMC